MIFLSFIVPVFNGERDIVKCLDSLCNQGLDESEYEVICVDDCSEDDTLHILEAYSAVHRNFSIIKYGESRKAGGARNTGLKHARGKYIWFIDSDDFLIEKSAVKLLSLCEKDDLDILCFNYCLFASGLFFEEKVFSDSSNVLKGNDFLNRTFRNGIIYHMGYPWRVIYDRELLLKNDIFFRENISYGEETTYMMEAIINAKRVSSTSEVCYCYRQNENSISKALEKQWRGDLIFQSIFVAGELVERLRIKSAEVSSELAENIKYGIPWFVNRLFIRMVKSNRIQRKSFYKSLSTSGINYSWIYEYMDTKNKFITRHSVCSMFLLDILSFVNKIRKTVFFTKNS